MRKGRQRRRCRGESVGRGDGRKRRKGQREARG